ALDFKRTSDANGTGLELAPRGRVLAEEDNPTMNRHVESRYPILDLELREDLLAMDVHRLFSDIERCGDFLVPLAHRDRSKHFDLALRQDRLRRTSAEPRGHSGRDGRAAGMYFTNDANEILGQRVLQQVRGGAVLKRRKDVFLAVVHRQDDDSRIGTVRTNS